MTAELDKQLCDKYPLIFRDRNASKMVTAMCWGFPGDGWYWIIDHLCHKIQRHIDTRAEDGKRNKEYNEMMADAKAGDFTKFHEYFDFLAGDNLEIAKQDVLKGKPKEDPTVPQVIATQVKEKFGTLSFYVQAADDKVRAYIEFAEHLSAHMCEKCGATTGVTQVGTGASKTWIKTLCQNCNY